MDVNDRERRLMMLGRGESRNDNLELDELVVGAHRNTMITKKKAAQSAQRRKAKRCSMVASAEVTDIGSNTRLSARISEIGIGGCYVDAMSPFPEGTVVEVRILRDQGTFEAKGKVVYCDSTMGMGLEFTEVAPAQRTLLEDWLAEIVAQLKPA